MANNQGNAAVMHEALKFVSKVLAKWRLDAPLRAWNEYDEAINRCRTALAAPLRNCDVVTVEEQNIQFEEYCRTNYIRSGCEECPLLPAPSCKLAWTQLPYESEVEHGNPQ